MNELENIPKLNGLVLAGGKSERMGTDKGAIDWHGKEQRYWLADLLGGFCEDVFISCRLEQAEGFDSPYKTLPDTFLGIGQYGGILTALQRDREKAWLVVACDLPLLGKGTLEELIAGRNPEGFATAFVNPETDNLPEPLIAIWEPESYKVLLHFLGEGITCPRKAIIKTEHKTLLESNDPQTLMNANTPEDAEKAREILSESGSGFESVGGSAV